MAVLIAVAILVTLAFVAFGLWEMRSPQARRGVEARRESERKMDLYDPFDAP